MEKSGNYKDCGMRVQDREGAVGRRLQSVDLIYPGQGGIDHIKTKLTINLSPYIPRMILCHDSNQTQISGDIQVMNTWALGDPFKELGHIDISQNN